jgi:N utilization substance protein B
VGRRRKAREIVLLVLFEGESSDSPWEEILENRLEERFSAPDTVDHARRLLSKTREHLAELDDRIRAALANWDFERVSKVDKNILRFGLAEILFFPDVPSKVIINEAIEIARKYSSEEAGKFVNGILDHFAQTCRQDVDCGT